MGQKGKVNTVTGSISANELGTTLMHEHFAAHFAGWEFDAKGRTFDTEVIAQHCAEKLKGAMAHGLKSIIDASPMDAGRFPMVDKRVAELTGLNVILCTGLHTEAQGASGYLKLRKLFGFNMLEEVYETYVEDITNGIRNTGIKAGLIKVSTGPKVISEYEEASLKAAARAQKKTGVPIITHTENGTMGPEQAQLLISEGADPKKIVIGHAGGCADMTYFYKILEQGCSLAFDRCGIYLEVPKPVVWSCIIGLIGMGYADRIMLSQDHIGYWLGREPAISFPTPDWTYTHVFTSVIPALKKAGVSDETIDTIMVGNIRRLFGGD
ncbi:MAG: phosphotriesterase-related protein [Pseudomonadota bacterium]